MTDSPACLGLTDLFYSEEPEDVAVAQQICARCAPEPWLACQAAAEEYDEKYGVWAGEPRLRSRRRQPKKES